MGIIKFSDKDVNYVFQGVVPGVVSDQAFVKFKETYPGSDVLDFSAPVKKEMYGSDALVVGMGYSQVESDVSGGFTVEGRPQVGSLTYSTQVDICAEHDIPVYFGLIGHNVKKRVGLPKLLQKRILIGCVRNESIPMTNSSELSDKKIGGLDLVSRYENLLGGEIQINWALNAQKIKDTIVPRVLERANGKPKISIIYPIGSFGMIGNLLSEERRTRNLARLSQEERQLFESDPDFLNVIEYSNGEFNRYKWVGIPEMQTSPSESWRESFRGIRKLESLACSH
jgi:hypothetical protein